MSPYSLCSLLFIIQSAIFFKGKATSDVRENPVRLLFERDKTCTYSYQVAIHTARGSHSTESQGHELHTMVDITPISVSRFEKTSPNIIRLEVYQPRIRRLRGNHVLVNHPVNEDFEEKLSNPFYFRQHDHGTVVDALFPRNDEPRVIALKKGIAGSFQVQLKTIKYGAVTKAEEHDDSGIYISKYTTLFSNDTHTTVKKEWTNNDYLEFADDSPVKGQHKVQSHHTGIMNIRYGRIHNVHRRHKGFFQSQKGHPRAENKKEYQEQEQDIQVSTSGYNKLTLIRCKDVPDKEGHHRSRRSAETQENVEKHIQGLHQENLVFKDSHKINWKEVGGEKIKFRPFYELMRCFTDPTVKNREIGECAREMHKLVGHDEATYKKICHLVLQRNHQNVTSWSVLISAVAGHGGHHAQSVLAQALMSEYPRRLTFDEYETLLEGIFHIPQGPIHKDLFDALFAQATRDYNHGHKSSMAMLVLAGLTKRAEAAGYNSTLSDVVAELIHNSYHNKSNVYDPDSVDHESFIRSHIWAFGNLGHSSGLEIMLKHADHKSSGIRSAVVSSMRKLPAELTNKFLQETLYNDEHNDVKAAVIDVYVERHEDLTGETVQALEHAIWHAEDGDALDAVVQEFLENHHNHPKAQHIRKRRRILRRQKRALVPALRPREYQLGPNKRWSRVYGGRWLGAETAIQFRNQVKMRVGIFGGKLEVDIDNYAKVDFHILNWGFDIVKGKAAFKASASFKNDIPKDLIHAVADTGDDILSKVDSITNIIFEQIQKFKDKLLSNIPLNIQKLLDFVSKFVSFVQNLFKPLKPIKLMAKLLNFVKKVVDRLKNWTIFIDIIKKIQTTLGQLNIVDVVFRKVIAVLDRILDIVNRITLRLPHNLPLNFKIEDLLKWLRNVSLERQDIKIKEFFKSLGFPVPGGFKLQLPFRFILNFPLSMEKFTFICKKLVSFANNFLDISSIFDVLQGIKLPRLNLPHLDGKLPLKQMKFFNFGLNFDWKTKLNFNLNLKDPGFLKLVKILGKLGEFLNQFKLHSFNLGNFFERIMPGKDLDLSFNFKDIFERNSNDTADNKGPDTVLTNFFNKILGLFDLSMPNINSISGISDFFQELGPAMMEFAGKGGKIICKVLQVSFKFSKNSKDFGDNLENEGIAILKKVDNTTQRALKELHNYTIIIDGLIDEIEKNFTITSRGFVSKSLKELSKTLTQIQTLADHIVEFANGTSSEVTGICKKGADVSTRIIDEVQNTSRYVFGELTKFAGPVAQSLKDIGKDLKKTVTKVEEWYQENMAVRVGKISKIARLIAEFMAVLNTKKGFLGKVREIAIKVNNVLTHMRNLPAYADKARQTADEIIQFADRAQNFKNEIQKLDIRKEFGINYDKKVRDLCNKFNNMASQTLNKIGSYDIIAEVNTFFTVEADKLINKAVTKFRKIKEPIYEIRGELKDMSSMVNQIMNVLMKLKPFTANVSPLLSTITKLPDCQQTLSIFTESTKPCVRKAMIVGKNVIDQYKDMRKEVAILKDMIPDTWKNFKIQKCVKAGATCISKVFIDQANVIKEKVDILKEKFKEASGYTDMLKTCQAGVDNITQIIDTVKLLIKQVKEFDLRDDVKEVKDDLRTITGRDLNPVPQSGRVRRDINGAKEKIKRVLDYIKKAKETKLKLEGILKNTFKAMKSVYNDAVIEHVQKIQDVRNKLQTSYDLWKKTKDINSIIQGLDNMIKEASDYAIVMQSVTNKFSNPVVKILLDTGELSDVIKPHMDKYIGKVKEASDKVNSFFDKVTEFQNKIQLRHKSLDPSQYKNWNEYPYCSADVCVRSLRRSSSLYYSTIFTWRFPHLDDLSSMKDCGRWLTPGLFDDYMVEGISQLSNSEIVLGMHGVSANKEKASILVITNPGSNSVRKIIQLGSPQSPFTEKIGGVSIARNSIWLSSGTSNKIYRINKGSVTGTLSSSGPSWVGISKSYTVEGTATSVSFDEATKMLWVTDGDAGKGYGYRLSPDGDLLSSNVITDRVLVIGKKAQGMVIVHQFGTEYVVVSRCAMTAGFQCKLEFHDLSGGDEVSESTLSRVVRTPSGLESVEKIRNDLIAIVFSSATYSEKKKVELIGGDFEDRHFKLKLPILKTQFGINENCLMFKVLRNWILEPRRLFPIGNLKCGTHRKRSIEDSLIESDVYSNELEDVHSRQKREAEVIPSCIKLFRGNFMKGYQQFMPEWHKYIIVFGVPVKLFAGAGGYYYVDYQGELCLKEKTFKVGLIPGASIGVYVGASVSLFIVEAGITIEAIVLDTVLIPELIVNVDRWPLKACIELKMQLMPLRIRVWLWYRFKLCIKIRCKCFSCSIRIKWCSKKTLAEWWWSAKYIERKLFSNCRKNVDTTSPTTGTCNAKQIGDKSYFVQWYGFKAKSIKHYWLYIGSILGSSDDYGLNVGTSLSTTVKNLQIMHGRDVYVSVRATNDQWRDSRLALCPVFKAKRRKPEIRYVYDGSELGQDKDFQSDDYGLGINFAWSKGDQSILDVRWGISTSSKCTLDENEVDVYGLMPVGETTSIQTSGLTLKHGLKYYTRIVATNSIGLRAVMCSDGIVIDTTPPVAGFLFDGSGKDDADYIPSTRRVRAKYQAFVDNESPLAKYEWKIAMYENSVDVTPFVNIPLTQRSPLMEGLNLNLGQKYKIIVRGTNAAGLQASVESNGFAADNTAPICGLILDVLSEKANKDVDFVRELESIQIKWKCSDPESGITEQLLAVGTYPGGDDIKSFDKVDNYNTTVLADGNYFVRVDGFRIKPRIRYHVTIKVLNGAGLRRTSFSDGILIDTTPPAVASQFVKDGLKGKDQNYTKERFLFSVHWEQAFIDAESGLSEYYVGLGTKPGLTDTKKLISVGKRNNVSLTGLLLESGRKYFATVVGCNGVQMCVNTSSNGAIVDYIPPHTGSVITGFEGPPVLFQWNTKSVWARWNWCPADELRTSSFVDYTKCSNNSFYDVHSGIESFGLSVTSLTSEQLLADVKKVGRVRMSGRAIELEDGIYSTFVEAKDKAGMKSNGYSNTFIVDSSPPEVLIIQHGHRGNAIKYTKDKEYTFKSFFEIEDGLTQIVAYKVSIGSYNGADDVASTKTIVLSQPKYSIAVNWTAEKAVKLENNRKYYVTVQAINSAGLNGIASSDSLLSDSEPPKEAVVMDGWGMIDAKYQSYVSIYRAHWHGIDDFSGIHSVYLGLKSTYNSKICDEHSLELTQMKANFHILSGLNLQSGTKYFACLKVVDNAQNEAHFSSNGVLVDNTPPLAGTVVDGNFGQDIDIQTESSILWASWSNFTEQETDIIQYRLAFGTSPGKQDIQEFTDVEFVESAASTRMKVSELQSGQRYYATVIAVNNLGIPSAMVSSNGVMVDSTPPEFISPVTDGIFPREDIAFTSKQTLSSSWLCWDQETPLQSIQLGFGLQPGVTNVKNFTTVPLNQTKYVFSTKLRSGIKYFAVVKCKNRMGLTSVSTSNGMVYDNSPPLVQFIDDGNYHNSTNKINLKWRFYDLESGIKKYRVFVHLFDNSSKQGPFEFSGDVTSKSLVLESHLSIGKTYFVTIEGTNGAGLTSSITSDGFKVDNTPPLCEKVWDGDKQHKDLRFIGKTRSLTVSWNCSDNESQLYKIQFTVQESGSGKVILPFHSLKQKLTSNGTAIITGNGRWNPKYEDGKTYRVGLKLTNAVKLGSVYWTNGVLVDTSPPVFKNTTLAFNPINDVLTASWNVKDLESGIASLRWGIDSNPKNTNIFNLTGIDKSIKTLKLSNSQVQLKLGKTYFLTLVATNLAGLSSRTVSNGVVIDRTKPEAGIVNAQYVLPSNYDRNKNVVPGSSFTVSWTGFVDKESRVSHYSWAKGENAQSIATLDDSKYTNVLLEESVGGVQIVNVTLVGNTTYYVCIRATNGAGLQRTDCSPGITILLGKFSAGLVNDGPRKSKKDLDFQIDDRALWAHWSGFKDPVYGVSSFEWCIGDRQPTPSDRDVCKWNYTKVPLLRTFAHRFYNLTLAHGTTYYATVKAINSRGESVRATSDGILIDRTGPVGRSITVSPSIGTNAQYVTSLSAPTVTWVMNDNESGLSYFRLGVGSYSFQDDLLNFTRIEGLVRSVDLDQFNFTMRHGMSFFVTVKGINMLEMESALVTQQVVVDTTPPSLGLVVDGNRTGSDGSTEDLDYQTNFQVLSAHWYGFEDDESYIVEYKWCIGIQQGTCTLTNFVSSGLLTYASISTHLQTGVRYYFTIQAINAAGLIQTSSSDGVTIDTSLPVISEVTLSNPSEDIALVNLGNLTGQSSGRVVKASWGKVQDAESDISSLMFCIGRTNQDCSIVELTKLDIDATSVVHYFERPLPAGTTVYVTLQAYNGAGLDVNATSNAHLLDSSSPDVGDVVVGNVPGRKYLQKDETIVAEWSGFKDDESGLDHFEWAVCLKMSLEQCITPFVNIGLTSQINNDQLDIKPGVAYVLVVRAYNKVGLKSEAQSNIFILDIKNPIPRSILDGKEYGNDITIQSSASTLAANWEHFIDYNSRIVNYQMCVGSKPLTCDIKPFQDMGITLRGEITGLSLSHMKTYYTTVRATNEAGYIATVSTNGVKIDSTPPIGGKVRDGIGEDVNYQAEDSFISANWDQFTDAESDIEKYVWCAGTSKGSCDVIPETDIPESTQRVAQQINLPISSGVIIYSRVKAINIAGGETTSYSNGVTIDNSPPQLNEIRDLQTNKTLKDKNFITSKVEYCATWNLYDLESDITKTEVSVCSDLNHNECLVSSMDVGNNSLICMSNLKLVEGEKYVTIVRVTNSVGLSTTRSSNGFLLDATPPITGEISHLTNESDSLDSLGKSYTSSDISVRMSGFWDKESPISKYYVCLGTYSGECDVANFTNIGIPREYSFKGINIQHNTMYYASVIAENEAGMRGSIVSSDGVLVDTTAPLVSGNVYDGNKDGKDLDFQQSTSDIKAHWKSFEDPESDVIKVTWCAGTTRGLCDIVPMEVISPWIHGVHIVLDSPMKNGHTFYVTVKATNGAGITKTLSSDGVTVDNSPPISGVVLDGNSSSDISYLLGDDEVQAQWSGFMDEESKIERYEVAVCDARNLTNCPQPYTTVYNATRVRFTGLDLDSGSMYIVLVKATNFAGLQNESSSNGFTVDFSPPKEKEAWLGPGNKHSVFQSSDNQIHVRWSSFEDCESGIFKYEICISLSSVECDKTRFIDVGQNTSYLLSGLKLDHGKSYHVTIKGTNGVGLTATVTTETILIDVTPPEIIDRVQDLNTSDFNYTSTPNGTNNNRLPDALNGSPSPSPYVRFTCTEELLSADWDEFDDPESGMSKYEWCVGTRSGICDIFVLTSVGLSLSGKTITTRIPSGTKLFATVNAVNNVGLKTVLNSQKCLVITGAPEVIDVLDLEYSNTSDHADADWMANMKSVSLKWNLNGKFIEDISRMRIEVAITSTSLNWSLPRINEQQGWNGEHFAQDFMHVHSSQRNVTIESAQLKPWQRYRGVVRVWNEGGIYNETSSDGVRIEPSPPLARKLYIRDKSPENERARWLPNLHLPPINKSALDKEVVYISSPSDVYIAVTTGINSTNSSQLILLDHLIQIGDFSPTQEFKVLVTRVTSDANETNTTEHSVEMKTLPGFSNPQGPCCANHTDNDQTMLTDNHMKPTLTTQKFGSSVVLLPHDYIAVASIDKFFIFSTKNRKQNSEVINATSHTIPGKPAVISYSEDRILLASSGVVNIYRYTFSHRGDIKMRLEAVISNCDSIACASNITWSNMNGERVVIHNATIAARGRTHSNSSLVGIFCESQGAWQLRKLLGTAENDKYFGQDITMNDKVLAVSAGSSTSSKVIIYSMNDFSVVMKIDLNTSSINMIGPSIRLTKQNELIMVSKYKAKSVVIQLNILSKSFSILCTYQSPVEIRLSGNFDFMKRDGGTIVALGMQTLEGHDGVTLMGFNGAFAYGDKVGNCIGLGKIKSRENLPRVDDGILRDSVSIYGSNIAFGTPGIITWPDSSENQGTGRVYTIKYCPRNYKRVKTSSVNGGIESYQCVPCEEGRKSLGGIASMCTICEGRKCVSPLADDPVHFTTKMCSDQLCPSNQLIINNTNGIKMIQQNGTFFEEGAANEYIVKLVETTRAGMSTTSKSEPFIIDTTSPVVGIVYDGQGSDPQKNCSSNETLGEDSQCSTRSFQDTDIDYTNNTSEVHARWIDFADNESDIVEYFWCLGSKPMLDDIRQCESTGQRQNGSHYGLDFKQGDTYYVTVIACNGAQRCSANHSNGVTIDVTPPTMQYVRDGVLGPDMDYQVFLDIIFVYFKGYDEESDISSYEVAWGTEPGLTDMKEYEEVGNIKNWFAEFKDTVLEKKKKYFATVRASNKAGLLSEPMSSDGIIVGKSEYIFDKNATASFFFDTVKMNPDGTRKDGGVGKTYGTLDVPEGAVDGEIKLKCYSLDNKTLASKTSEDGPVSNPDVTKPKQFMLGNYSFQIKAMDPYNDTTHEGYKFVKPIKISMFYDVDNLVRANKRVVNNEIKKEDIDPVLYLWDLKNNSWMDASLTCPEPWYHVNRTIKLLTVQICHLTQFAFFWSFKAENGLLMFDKNSSVFNEEGDVFIVRQPSVQRIELPIKRSKGASGIIEVHWSLYSNETIELSKLIWPSSGKINLLEGQWNATLPLNVADREMQIKEQVITVRIINVTGGGILASPHLIQANLIIPSNLLKVKDSNSFNWIIGGSIGALAFVLILALVLFALGRHRFKIGPKNMEADRVRPSMAFVTEMQRSEVIDALNDGHFDSCDKQLQRKERATLRRPLDYINPSFMEDNNCATMEMANLGLFDLCSNELPKLRAEKVEGFSQAQQLEGNRNQIYKDV